MWQIRRSLARSLVLFTKEPHRRRIAACHRCRCRPHARLRAQERLILWVNGTWFATDPLAALKAAVDGLSEAEADARLAEMEVRSAPAPVARHFLFKGCP